MLFVHQRQLGRAHIVVERIIAGPFVECHKDDILDRQLGAFLILLAELLVWGKVEQPVVEVDHICLGGHECGFDHQVLIHAQDCLGLDKRVVLHLPDCLAEISFQLVLLGRVQAMVKTAGFGGAPDDFAVAIVQHLGISGKIVQLYELRIDRKVGDNHTRLLFGHFISLADVEFANVVVVD